MTDRRMTPDRFIEQGGFIPKGWLPEDAFAAGWHAALDNAPAAVTDAEVEAAMAVIFPEDSMYDDEAQWVREALEAAARARQENRT